MATITVENYTYTEVPDGYQVACSRRGGNGEIFMYKHVLDGLAKSKRVIDLCSRV